MASTFEKLAKILALEQDQGFRDRAVIGGLERFLPRWHQEAQEGTEDPEQLRRVEEILALLEGYGAKERGAREGVISKVLGEMEGQQLPPSPRKPSAPGAREVPAMDIDAPVTRLTGLSTAYARRLARLGVTTIRDLLTLVPRRYDDFSALKTINKLVYGEEVTIVGTVWDTKARETRGGVSVVTTILSDATGTIQATWFNQPYLVKQLQPGRQIVISGKVDMYLGRLTFQSPSWEPLEKELIHTARLVPVYPLTKGLGARWLRRLMKRVVDTWASHVPEYLPDHVREREGLLDISTALRQIHFPDHWEMVREARRRLSFDEFLWIQLGVLRQRRNWQRQVGRPMSVDGELVRTFLDALPFTLTDAQRRALREILGDLKRSRPMSRLLQGDVGSGKTVVAVAAMLTAVANGYQAVLMAPTEILAEQHGKNVSGLLQNLAPALSESAVPAMHLLTGSLSRSDKECIHEEAATGEVDIVVGTHALIQEGVSFKNLGLAVIDEQHRFGVTQRAALRQKGYCPHLLVMSATPIPRTLALTVYGDLDISVIDELPPGRQEIKTRWLSPRERERAYGFVRSQIERGRQAFIICPLIEESEKIETRAAVVEYERLQKEIFPDLRLGLLHGRMKAREKEATMGQFYQGELDILVSTPVVEVGIDVPNATVMLIEGADRFGLAQLHQFRGRVGRGEHQSYCLLLADSPGSEAEERLKVIESTQDGFQLAEEDLKLRGPGEFFGTRQSGLPDLKVARLSDVAVLERARAEALEIFRRDPELAAPEHALLVQKVETFWQGDGDLS